MKKNMIVCLLLLFLLTGCGKQVAQSDFFAMDTFMSIAVYADTQDQATQSVTTIEQQINALEQQISRTRDTSEIAQLNHAEGAWTQVSQSTYEAVARAVEFAVWTNGAYDPTVATLTDLWAIGTDAQAVPTATQLAQTLQTVGYENINLRADADGYWVQLENDAQLDLGGIGKGLAADLSQQVVADLDALLMLGGNIVVQGENPNRDSGLWTVGIANPDQSSDAIAVLSLTDTTVVTSGDYERYFEQDGVRYHHILDPKTGMPAQSRLRSVTVVLDDSTMADALTTALFVMGLEQAQVFCAENDIDAVFVTVDKTVIATENLQDKLEFIGTEAGYTYVA